MIVVVNPEIATGGAARAPQANSASHSTPPASEFSSATHTVDKPTQRVPSGASVTAAPATARGRMRAEHELAVDDRRQYIDRNLALAEPKPRVVGPGRQPDRWIGLVGAQVRTSTRWRARPHRTAAVGDRR